MAKVPTKEYDARLPTPQITPRNLGDVQRAQMNLGTAVQNIAKTAERHADENRETEVQEYRIKANNFFVEDYRSTQETTGKGALGTINRYDTDFEKRKEDFMSDITDGKVRDSVGMLFDDKSQIHRGRLAQYEAGQRKQYQDSLQKNTRAVAEKTSAIASGAGEIEGIISETTEYWVSFNKGATATEIQEYDRAVVNQMHLSKVSRLAIDNPAMLGSYWDKNKEFLEKRLTEKAYAKAKSYVDASERDASSNSTKKFNEQKNAAIDTLNTGIRSAKSHAELLVLSANNETYKEAGIYGTTMAATAETIRKSIDARGKAIDKQSFNRRVIYEGETASKEQYRTANNNMFAEHTALIGDEQDPLKRVGHTLSYFSNPRVTELPLSLTEKWGGAQATGDQQLIKEALIEYSQIKKYRPRIVGDYAKGDVKTRAWWSSLEKLAGAQSKSGNIYEQDIQKYIDMVNSNVYELDDNSKLKFNTELKKLKNKNFKADSDDLYQSLTKPEDDGLGIKSWLISSSESIPEEAWLDYKNLYNSYYKYTGGDASLAKEKAEEDFKLIYGNIIQAQKIAMEKNNAK